MRTDFHWGWPEAAYLLFAVLFFGFLFWSLYEYRRSRLHHFAMQGSLDKILVPRSRIYFLIIAFCLLGTWAAAIFALMQPLGHARYPAHEQNEDSKEELRLLEEIPGQGGMITRKRPAHEVIFLIDASASMNIKDTRVQLTRLEYAKEIVDEVVSLLDGQSVSLYAFTSELTPLVPSTMDYLFMRMALRNVEINEGDVAGTDFLEVLESLRKQIFIANNQLKTVILLSDGGDTRLESMPLEKRDHEEEAILSRLNNAQSYHIQLFAVGMGTKEGGSVPNVLYENKPVESFLEEDLLIKLSKKGGGDYFAGESASPLVIAKEIVEEMRKKTAIEEEEMVKERTGKVERMREHQKDMIYDHYFQWPLGLAVLLLSIALLFPEVRGKVAAKWAAMMVILLFPFAAGADELPTEWRDAQAYFQAKEYDQAAESYEALLAKKLPTSQKAIALVNYAAVQIARKQWEKAIGLLCQVPVDKNIDLSLFLRAKTYEGYSLLNLGKEILSHSQEKDSDYKEQLNKAMHRLKQSIHSLDQAEEIYPQVNEVSKEPGQEQQLVALKREVKDQMLSLRTTIDNYHFAHMTLQERLNHLVVELHQTNSEIESLAIEKMPAEAKKRYLEEYAKELRGHKVHWDIIRQEYDQLPDDKKDNLKMGLLKESENHLLKAIDLFRDGDAYKGFSQLAISAEAAALLARVEQKKDPMEGVLMDRQLIREKKEILKEYPELISAMGEEEAYMTVLASLFANSLKVQWKDNPQWVSQIESLIDFLSQSGSEQEAAADLLFYQQIPLTEARLLEQLYKQSVFKPDSLIKKPAMFFMQLKLLKRKADVNHSLASSFHSKIQEALAFDQSNRDPNAQMDQIRPLLREALMQLEPLRVFKVELESLMREMEAAVAEKPWNQAKIKAVSTQIQELLTILGQVPQSPELLVKDLSEASNEIAEGLKRAENAKEKEGILFIQDAIFFLQAARGSLEMEEEEPSSCLSRALNQQSWAKVLLQSIQEMNEKKVDESMNALISKSQERTLRVAQSFTTILQNFLTKQQPSTPLEQWMQQNPWKEVVPLFQSGLHAAEEALRLIQKTPMQTGDAADNQNEAIKDWKEAIEKLKQSQDQDQDQNEKNEKNEKNHAGNQEENNDACSDLSQEQQQHQEEQEKQQQKNEQEQNQSEKNADSQKQVPSKIFEQLQQMEQDDQKLNPAPPKRVREGLRPW